MKLQTVECPKCHKMFEQHRHNHTHCSICAYEISVQKGVERARAKRLAAKEKKS